MATRHFPLPSYLGVELSSHSEEGKLNPRWHSLFGCARNIPWTRAIASPSESFGTSGVAVGGTAGSEAHATPKESASASRSIGRSLSKINN